MVLDPQIAITQVKAGRPRASAMHFANEPVHRAMHEVFLGSMGIEYDEHCFENPHPKLMGRVEDNDGDIILLRDPVISAPLQLNAEQIETVGRHYPDLKVMLGKTSFLNIVGINYTFVRSQQLPDGRLFVPIETDSSQA